MTTASSQWYRLDSAAIIFPAVTSKKITTLFRLSCDFNETINIQLLQAALEKIIDRFPYFRVHLKRGLFWYYFETNPNIPRVVSDTNVPCAKLAWKEKGVFPFRVTYHEKRLAVEFSHVITDATGALIFLKSLAACYLDLKGISLQRGKGIFYHDEKPDPEETEDAYRKFFKGNLPFPVVQKKAFCIPYHMGKWHFYYITTGIIPLKPLMDKAHEYNVTLTTFITAVLFQTLQDFMIDLYKHRFIKSYKAIRIMLPINLRKMYSSKTLKNFSLYVIPGVDPRLGIYTFSDIIKTVDLYLKMEVNEKNIMQQLSRNVQGANFIKFLPLFLKNIVFSYFYAYYGKSSYTTSISNLGLIDLPEDMKPHITRFEFYPQPMHTIRINSSSLSYGDKFYISFGRTGKETEIEKRFFRKLINMGIPVKIETNNFI